MSQQSYRVWITAEGERRYRGAFKSLDNAVEMLKIYEPARHDGTTIEIRVSSTPWEYQELRKLQ